MLPTDEEFLHSECVKRRNLINLLLRRNGFSYKALVEFLRDIRSTGQWNIVLDSEEAFKVGSPVSASLTTVSWKELNATPVTTPLLDNLREEALFFFPEERGTLSQIPVGLASTTDLSARRKPTPRGGSIILVNDGILAMAEAFVQAYTAFFGWQGADPFCKHHPQLEFGNTILALATCVASGRGGPLFKIKTFDCPTECPSARHSSYITKITEMIGRFILMHEYAHVVLGHSGTFSKPLADRHQEEFDADALAVRKWLSVPGAVDTDVALISGMILRFFDLAEAIATRDSIELTDQHPTSISRWRQIQKMTNVASKPTTFAFRVDQVFDFILSAGHLPPCSQRE